MSQFLALYGYHPPSITSPLKGYTKVQGMEDHIGNQQEVLKRERERGRIGERRPLVDGRSQGRGFLIIFKVLGHRWKKGVGDENGLE
jgi:hypothetical protein